MVENDLIYSQLCDALNGNDVDQVLTLLRNSDVNIDLRDVTHDLQTFLMRMCYIQLETSDLVLVLEAIFNLKPDVNIQDSWGRTVLMHSCIANKPVLIEGLLEYDVTDVSVIDFDGNSALTYAVQNCDVYTVEDILQHNLGPSLIQVHNAKGHSPYIIVKKAKNQTLLQLFDDWLSKTAREKSKSRKPRNRDVRAIKLPPAYSPSPERECRNSPPNKVAPLNIRQVSQCNMNTKISARDSSEESYSEQSEKSNSGDFIQSNSRDEILTTLSLSSPRLTRRHHKQDCLLQETLLLNQSRHFPHMKSLRRNESKEERALALPEYSLCNQRRPSLSLPDLRNVSGFLVNSGSSTPTTEGDESERKFTRLKDYSDDDDNEYDSNGIDDENDEVFSKSYPNSANTARSSISNRSGKSNVTLPDINSRKTTTAFPSMSRKGVIPLSRRRKFSNSDDQIHRSSGIEKS